MANQKFELMWHVLSERSFDLNNQITDDLSCVECKNILVDARQAPCGCKFCVKCIENCISAGNKICPGNREECSEEILTRDTNISVDYRTNNVISRLKVKCPNDGCHFESELKNIGDHLAICKAKLVNGKRESNDLIEITESISELAESIKIIKEMCDRNKQEIAEMKEIFEKNNSRQFEVLKREIIDLKSIAKEEIAKKVDTKSNQNSIDSLKELLRKREREIETINQENEEIRKTFSEQLKQQMQVYLEETIVTFVGQMRSLYETQLQSITADLGNKNCESNKNLNKIENGGISKSNNLSVLSFSKTWTVDKLSKILDGNCPIESDEFLSTDSVYRMRLKLMNNGDSRLLEPHLSVILRVENGRPSCENQLVTVMIENPAISDGSLSLTQLCPVMDGHSFNFLWSDLPDVKDLKDDSISIKCFL